MFHGISGGRREEKKKGDLTTEGGKEGKRGGRNSGKNNHVSEKPCHPVCIKAVLYRHRQLIRLFCHERGSKKGLIDVVL